MIFTYVIIFVFFIFLALIVMYLVHTFVMPKKVEEIAALIEAGQTRLAINKLNEILEKDDRNGYAHFLLAEAYLKENNTKYAIVEYRQVLKIAKFDDKVKEIPVRATLAKLFLSINANEDAKKELLLLTTLDPDNYENYFQLGVMFLNIGVTDKALNFFKRSAMLNPRHDQSFYNMGQIFYRNSLYGDAKNAFVEAIKIDPQNYRAHYFLGLVLRQAGDFDWAIKEFEVAQKSDDLKVKAFLAKGSCFMEKGLHPRAIQEFERGLKYARRGTETELNLRYFLAECQEKMRDVHAAIFQWEKISEVKPEFRDVKEKLKTYSEFRQDDRIKDFLIAGLSHFEHMCRKIVEAMSHTIVDVNIISDTEIEIIATEADGKWRNTRQSNKIFRILRTTDTIQEKYLRILHEDMRSKNATRILVITTGDYAQSAVTFANTRPIELYGKSELINMLKKT